MREQAHISAYKVKMYKRMKYLLGNERCIERHWLLNIWDDNQVVPSIPVNPSGKTSHGMSGWGTKWTIVKTMNGFQTLFC